MRRPVIYVLLIITVMLAGFLRLYNMPDRPVAHDAWLWTVGINLHDTSFFNLGAHLTENFFKSLLYTPHGLTDTLPNYVASWIYDISGIPINEFWLYFVHAFLGILSVVLIFFVGSALFDEKVGLLSAGLLVLLPIEIKTYGSSLILNHDFMLFLQLFLFLSFFHYRNRKNLPSAIFFSIMLGINAGTENIIILPFVLLLHYFMEYEREKSLTMAAKIFFKEVLSVRHLLIWIFPAALLCSHLYIYYRIGESNLGMIGYVLSKWGPGSSKPGFLLMAADIFRMTYNNFFGIYLVSVIIMSGFHVFSEKKRLNMRLISLIFWFLFFFAVNAYFGQGGHIYNFRYSHFFLPLILTSAYISIYTFEYLDRLKISHDVKKFLRLFLFSFFAVLLVYNLYEDVKIAWNRNIYLNPQKAVSFYVRERANPESTVFQLVPKGSKRNMQGEFYFGRSFMEPGDETGVKRQLFSFGEHSIDEYKNAYGLKDFDFYVLYHDGIPDKDTQSRIKAFLGSLEKRGLKKVADIEKEGKTAASIYSPHLFSYEKIGNTSAPEEVSSFLEALYLIAFILSAFFS